MACAGPDHNADARMNIQLVIVKLHLGTRLAFQKVVRFGEPFVIVELAVQRDLGDMQGARKIRDLLEGSPRGPTRPERSIPDAPRARWETLYAPLSAAWRRYVLTLR